MQFECTHAPCTLQALGEMLSKIQVFYGFCNTTLQSSRILRLEESRARLSHAMAREKIARTGHTD